MKIFDMYREQYTDLVKLMQSLSTRATSNSAKYRAFKMHAQVPDDAILSALSLGTSDPWISIEDISSGDQRGAFYSDRPSTVVIGRSLAQKLRDSPEDKGLQSEVDVVILRGILHWFRKADWTDQDSAPGVQFESEVARTTGEPIASSPSNADTQSATDAGGAQTVGKPPVRSEEVLPELFVDLRDSYTSLWSTMTVREEWRERVDQAARGILKHRGRYHNVEDLSNVPWFVVGLIHKMESDGNFETHLHNGDPLSSRTSNEPVGRPKTGAPPFTWEKSAADAIQHSKLDQVHEWSVERICFELEKYNGFRSRRVHKINTPYLWSGTTHYERGKYVKDNVWDPNAVSRQVGAIPILKRLVELDASISGAIDKLQSVGILESSRASPDERDGWPDLKEWQERVSKVPVYEGVTDGRFEPASRAAIRAFLVKQGVSVRSGWTTEQLITAGLQALCHLDGIDVGEIDGIEGEQTRFAFSVYEARKRGDNSAETWRDEEERHPPLVEPSPKAKANWPRESEVGAFFGDIGQNQTKLVFPYPMRLAWDTDAVVKSTSCHKKVHDAAHRVLSKVLAHYGSDGVRELRLDLFGGCLNVRKKRGGSAWSMHAWGIAFDFDPDRNRLKWGRDKAAFARREYEKWFDFWEEEGAISLGRSRNRDWMHIQFARF